MLAGDLLRMLEARTIYESDPELLKRDYTQVFAGDMMSDVLAMLQKEQDRTVLITGLCNMQALRTAEMLDLQMIVFCRNKVPNEAMLEVARSLGFNVYTTAYTMFTTCGKLYEAGLRGTNETCSS